LKGFLFKVVNPEPKILYIIQLHNLKSVRDCIVGNATPPPTVHFIKHFENLPARLKTHKGEFNRSISSCTQTTAHFGDNFF